MDLEIKVLELCEQVQKLQERIDDLESREDNKLDDTETLIKEEVHWLIKVCRRCFCYK